MRFSFLASLNLIRLLTIWPLTLYAAAAGMPPTPARAAPLNTLHSFCAKLINGDTCKDGREPLFGALLMDSAGNLFGTTPDGGPGKGILYELVANTDGTDWTYVVRYRFNAIRGGLEPDGPLIMDLSGNLYGVAGLGGANHVGVVYELSPVAGAKLWNETVLYDFCADGGTCADGSVAVAGLTYQGAATGLPYDGTSPLFGVTLFGGAHGGGVVFRISPSGRRQWHEKVLHDFCSSGGDQCTDGTNSRALLIMDAAGNLYGTTDSGGAGGVGVVFELTPQAHQWNETVLYSFCAMADCADGANTVAGLAMDSSGALYGTTYDGGANGAGTAFKLVPNGAQSQYAVLHDFCSDAGCADGGKPFAALALDNAGNLYGTASNGGARGSGTIFGIGKKFAVLYNFCMRSGCKDGESPQEALIRDGAGNLFGATHTGGQHGEGTVFELPP